MARIANPDSKMGSVRTLERDFGVTLGLNKVYRMMDKIDDLKQNGYSKDGKFNQPYVLLALLVTTQGIPIGYEVYPGKTFEGHTLKDALSSLQNKYNVNKLIFVADAAMVGKDNLALLEQAQCPYIISARIKNMDRQTQEKILDGSIYKDVDNQDISILDLEMENGMAYAE